MKIIGHETWVVRVPFEPQRAATHIVLQLNTDEGAQGVSYVTALVPWTVNPIRAAVNALMERVVGASPLAVESLNAGLLTRLSRPQFDGLARSAVSLIDIVLWDLKAKALGLPLYRLLGAARNMVPVYAAWNLFAYSAADIDAMAASAAEHKARGFRAMKFHAGRVPAIKDVVACTRLLRETVGDDVKLCLDLNWRRTVKGAIELGRALEPFKLFWIEDPIPANDYDGLRQITQTLETSICAGETYYQASEFRSLLDRRGADVVMIDLEVGGLTQWLKMARLAEAYGVPVTDHVGTEISAHAMAAVDGLIGAYIPWAKPLFKDTPPVVEGKLVLFERPGLGIELDPAALNRFAL
jgi:L-alanine-DL-glutamate epimerase-like enolase superfamily enzyme